MRRIRRCKRCIIPVDFPHITFDRDDICNMCRDYDRIKRESGGLKREYEGRFIALLEDVAGKGTYDVLMCYSGGKDSSYTLSLLKRKYKLNILAFTFDNGFFADRAYINMRNVVENLDIDHLIFKPRFPVLKKIFRASAKTNLYPAKTLERAGTICTSCAGLLKYMSLTTAIEKGIPLIGFGWSPGQAPITSSILAIAPAMIRGMENIIKKPLTKIAGEDINAYFLSGEEYGRPGSFPKFVHPLAFNDYDEKKLLKSIAKLGWRKPAEVDYNATNCLLNAFSDEVHIRKYGFHPYVLEIANFVREGYMTRQEGLRHIPFEKNKKVARAVKKRLGL